MGPFAVEELASIRSFPATAVALARARLERGAEDEALEAVEPFENDFAAAGIAARVRLSEAGVGADAFAKLGGEPPGAALGPGRVAAVEALLTELPDADEDTREDLRRAIVGILSEVDPADPTARDVRRRLAAALY